MLDQTYVAVVGPGEANPRQVDPAAILFNTRKTVGQQQGGVTVERRMSDDTTVRLTGYTGHRSVRQYLALSGIGLTFFFFGGRSSSSASPTMTPPD